jgi:hypothetical protein
MTVRARAQLFTPELNGANRRAVLEETRHKKECRPPFELLNIGFSVA